MISIVKLFNFYRRYKWRAIDFEEMQETLYGYPSTILKGLIGNGVISGFDYVAGSGLTFDVSAGVAMNSNGALLATEDAEEITVADNAKSLIVIRPVTTNEDEITRPTSPFDNVFLKTHQIGIVLALEGGPSTFPTPAAGDVILFGVTTNSGLIVDVDLSVCELAGKSEPLGLFNPYKFIVGNRKFCTHRLLDEAITDATEGDKIRIVDNLLVSSTIIVDENNLELHFDPAVEITNAAGNIGLQIEGDGVKVRGGRFTGFNGGGEVAIQINSDYCFISQCRFSDNTTDVADSAETSSILEVINE